ncbi:hypothetical protein [Nonomuraea fuscirosea]|uniref:hypothetical protein n=1 Tax=Nonomuraea fuscirosea TaxID=1291556 RepID=UPI001C62D5B0|nr:hypothetical protein [Nonomuraea fuscirosea]
MRAQTKVGQDDLLTVNPHVTHDGQEVQTTFNEQAVQAEERAQLGHRADPAVSHGLDEVTVDHLVRLLLVQIGGHLDLPQRPQHGEQPHRAGAGPSDGVLDRAPRGSTPGTLASTRSPRDSRQGGG